MGIESLVAIIVASIGAIALVLAYYFHGFAAKRLEERNKKMGTGDASDSNTAISENKPPENEKKANAAKSSNKKMANKPSKSDEKVDTTENDSEISSENEKPKRGLLGIGAKVEELDVIHVDIADAE